MTERMQDSISKWIIGISLLLLGTIGGVASTNWAMHDTDRTRMGGIERVNDVQDVRLVGLEQDRLLLLETEKKIIINQERIMDMLRVTRTSK